jgi:transcriptional regulator with GAF, ATPase, and Fis domain
VNDEMPQRLEDRTVLPLSTGVLRLPPFPWTENIERLLAYYEQAMIRQALFHTDGVKRRAASLLGISRYALERRLHRLEKHFDRAATLPPKPVAAANVPSPNGTGGGEHVNTT